MKHWNNNPLIKQFEQWQALSPRNNQAEFARRCGVTRGMMCRYLNNKSLVSAVSMVKLCKALKCKAANIIESEEINNV